MIKSFFSITENSPVVVPVAGPKIILINAGSSRIFLTDADTDTALQVLDDSAKRAVLNALYSIEPGKSLKLNTGTYSLNLGESLSSMAVLQIEMPEPKIPAKQPAQPAPVVPPAPAPVVPPAPPVVENPPAPVENPQPTNPENPPAPVENSQPAAN